MRGPTRLLGLCAAPALANCATPIASPTHGDYLFAWTKDADFEQSDFLAVIDLDRNSPTFATVVATAPTGEKDGTVETR